MKKMAVKLARTAAAAAGICHRGVRQTERGKMLMRAELWTTKMVKRDR